MNKLVKFGAAAAALVMLASAAGAQASVLYSQPFNGTGNMFASQNDPNEYGAFATMYDNFTLGSAAKITSVDFTGQYFEPASPGPITAFTLQIWADSAGQPGASLYSVDVAGDAGETSLGSFGGFPTFTYSIATNFDAAAGTTYWLSIVPDLVYPPQWGWAQASNSGVVYQDFFGDRSRYLGDLAFTLNAGGVPEPATWALLILGFGMIGFAARRRRTGIALAA